MKRYNVQQTVFSGPYSVVERAIDIENKKIVALKVVDADFNFKPHNVRHEIDNMKKMENQNICQCLDVFNKNEDIVLVMPFYSFDLQQWINRCRRKKLRFNLNDPSMNKTHYVNDFPHERIVPIIRGLSNALAYLHGMGIIHRDIKPSNVLFLSEHGSPVLTDFGVSYNVNSPPEDEKPKSKYTDVCTGIYKPPELCFGCQNYGYEVDIWSLGIILTVLYSNQGASCIDSEASDHDLALINSIFKNFGTPLVSDETDPRLYWPDAKDPQCHFTKFNFYKYPRKPSKDLLPRCQNEELLLLFDKMTSYQGSFRISSGGIVSCLDHLTSPRKRCEEG